MSTPAEPAAGTRQISRQAWPPAIALEETERVLRGRDQENRAAREMQRRQYPLGRQEAIGDHPDEERRDHGGQRRRSGGEPDLRAGKTQLPSSHVPIVTDRAPQTKYWRNISVESFRRM